MSDTTMRTYERAAMAGDRNAERAFLVDRLRRGEPPVLCYVKDSFAWFTTQPLEKQWGDDWNDAPWEHNAGTPYAWHGHLKDPGPFFALVRVAFESRLETPGSWELNSRWSVQAINAKAVAWLTTGRHDSGPTVVIHAGTTLPAFVEAIEADGGEVFVPRWLGGRL